MSTDDYSVKSHLRSLGEPICKFFMILRFTCLQQPLEIGRRKDNIASQLKKKNSYFYTSTECAHRESIKMAQSSQYIVLPLVVRLRPRTRGGGFEGVGA